MTAQKLAHRPLVALMLPRGASALVVYAGHVVAKVTDNPSLSSPNPPLATISQAIDDLRAAQTASLSRTRGTITVRDEKRRTLVVLMQRLAATVHAAAAADRASYEWQLSIDAGHTWVLLPVTLRAKTTVTGLTPGSTATFRYRPVTKAGEGDWSQEVAIVVV